MADNEEKVFELRKVLNVGGNSKLIPIPGCFAGWQHDLLDIDPEGEPDLCCDARELHKTKPRVYDALYCSHNLEHFCWHELPRLLLGFKLVLKKEGFAFLRVPDLSAVMKAVVEGGLDLQDVLYMAGPTPIKVHDVFYGWGLELERSGNDFYAHKCGFTEKSLKSVLEENGFPIVFTATGSFDLSALAFKQEPTEYQRSLLKLPFDRAAGAP
jgi:hypothetical protein